ncbi:MAG TPA: response regulator [Methanothrix sp.]|nr:response regulator [Methanothrix sp.]HOV81861.1 response regulator [Methanothrix sp.]HPC89687.1 response regulator [Methanothrix sp.]HQE87641.1 response regulator [Methanothrix sp.]HQI68526.1 response regulator [Methanothrix sp.]
MPDCGAGQTSIKAVLLVEDEEDHAEIIRRVFEEDGLNLPFHHVWCIDEALRWLETNKAAATPLVISNYNLPDGSVLDLARGASTPEEIGFPLIILTAAGSEKLTFRTLRSGPLDYVVKSSENLRLLPRMASHVIREWNLITERKYAESELKNFINDLNDASSRLEDVLDGISHDLDESISSIRYFSKIFKEKYAEKLGSPALEDLKKVSDSAEKADELLDRLFEYVVPIYFDSSMIDIYSNQLNMLENEGKVRASRKEPETV